MSTTKWVASIVGMVIVLGVIWYLWSQSEGPNMATPLSQTSAGATSTAQNGSQPSTIASGDSNADLNADLNTIDSQTNSANSDSASVDQSFNDQPVQQSQL